MKWSKYIYILILIAFCNVSFSQTYPVQLSAQLIPPYSGYLPDYADPSSEKLKIIIQFNDFTTPQYNLRLKIEIKGNGFSLVTKQLFNPPPLTVQPGVPLLLSGADLAPYLNSNNLDFIGINQSQYEQRMALPEGYYSICVKAYDYYNAGNIQVSNESCSQAWFTLSDPPFLNLPQCGKNIAPQTPQNILFQWTPMNLSSPNSAANTEYEFSLWEVRPDSSANPNQIVLSTAPIFSTTTNLTLLNYGISEPALNLYMKYVWRVRAIDITGRDWFKNSGYSQICTFVYGNASTVLGNSINLNLTAQGITHRLGKCTWNTQSLYTSYLLQVRKDGTQNWFDYNCTTGSEKVTNLEPNTNYEARVKGEGVITSDWSNTATFNTLPEPNYSCGDVNINADALAPLPLSTAKAIPGLIIQTGQFEVFVTQINPSGPPGWFSGKGYAKVFGVLPLAVQFNNIYIDDNNRHQQGVIQALTQGITNWVHQWDIKNAEENSTYINGIVDSVYVNGNQICVKIQGNAGDSCFAMPDNQDVIVVRDDKGNQWTVTIKPPPPTVTGPSNYLVQSTDALDASDSTIVEFEKSPTQQYGFDEKKYTAWITHYELIKLKNGKNYFVPFKSIGENQSDEVYANITIVGFVPTKLSFKSENNLQLTSASVSNNLYKVTIPSQTKSVYAWYDGKKIGKLNVISLKAIAKKLVIVPINNASINSQTLNNQTLNSIFKQANVNFNVTVKPNYNFNLGNDGLEAADATLMTKYSTEMRALRDAYKKYDSLYDKEAYYIFVVNNFSDASINGYMVRGRALGFVTSNASVKDIAHELAHGAFGLEHTFPAIAKKSSDNLMDYESGTELGKVQWEEMQTRPSTFIWLGDDEEDASMGNDRIKLMTLLTDIKTAFKDGGQISLGTTWNQLYVDKTFLAGLDYDYINLFKVTNKSLIKPKNGINNVVITNTQAVSNSTPIYKNYILIDSCLQINVPEKRIGGMLAFLKSLVPAKNLILFVNGYRPIVKFDGSNHVSILEYENSDNNIYYADTKNYWKGMDSKFINRIGTRNAVYADGNMGVYTSNHLTIQKFAASMISALRAKNAGVDIGYEVIANGNLTFNSLTGTCYHVDSCVHLSTVKNTAGFSVRKSNGYFAGQEMVKKINNGTIAFNKATDVVDIVAHSMGYAYGVGMINALHEGGVKFGNCYIVAPENACSGGTKWDWFEEVWQYGADLDKQSHRPLWEQDGIAPQCQVTGLELVPTEKGGRVYIPDNAEHDFLNSHSIEYYGWMFDKQFGQDGYIKPRK